MDRPNVDSFKPNLFHENVSAAIDSANYEVGGQGEEQSASCREKKACDRAAVDGEVPQHLDQLHLEMKSRVKIFSLPSPPQYHLHTVAGRLHCEKSPPGQ